MLVLTRHKNETIIIEIGGARLELRVVDLRPDKVRLGFEGPASFKVYRSELLESVTAETQAAAVGAEELSMRMVPVTKPDRSDSPNPDRN